MTAASDNLYVPLAAAFARSSLGCADASDDDALERARAEGLKVHRFKRSSLQRVRRVLGTLRGLAPESLLDIGSGRGAFLWPLLDAFPGLPVTSLDQDPRWIADIERVAEGGVATLRGLSGDVRAIDAEDDAFDVVTILEVLEHLPDPERAAAEVLRVARRFVVASVPSKPDDNPGHIQLFDRDRLSALFTDAGAARVKVEFVLNHMVAVISVRDRDPKSQSGALPTQKPPSQHAKPADRASEASSVGRKRGGTLGGAKPPPRNHTMSELRKYPRTQHVEGSRLQPGDHDLEAVPFADLAGKHLVVEEKLDGSNSAISFDGGELRLQSRGHFLRGGASELQFALLKTWAVSHQSALRAVLGERYVVYGEWLYAKHTVFYDRLPHYFMEFDVLDREADRFLSTPARRALLDGLPVAPVPVVSEGPLPSLDALTGLIRPSLYKSPTWLDSLHAASVAAGQDPERVMSETDMSGDSEGLYVKWEEDGAVRGRYKVIRTSFFTKVQSQETHWIDRPIVPNGLRDGVDLFAVAP